MMNVMFQEVLLLIIDCNERILLRNQQQQLCSLSKSWNVIWYHLNIRDKLCFSFCFLLLLQFDYCQILFIQIFRHSSLSFFLTKKQTGGGARSSPSLALCSLFLSGLHFPGCSGVSQQACENECDIMVLGEQLRHSASPPQRDDLCRPRGLWADAAGDWSPDHLITWSPQYWSVWFMILHLKLSLSTVLELKLCLQSGAKTTFSFPALLSW